MSAAARCFVIALIAMLGGGIYVASLSSDERLWDERAGIRQTAASTARMKASRTGSPIDRAEATILRLEAEKTGRERFQTNRYTAYGVVAVGCIFALVGFTLLGAASRARDRTQTD